LEAGPDGRGAPKFHVPQKLPVSVIQVWEQHRNNRLHTLRDPNTRRCFSRAAQQAWGKRQYLYEAILVRARALPRGQGIRDGNVGNAASNAAAADFLRRQRRAASTMDAQRVALGTAGTEGLKVPAYIAWLKSNDPTITRRGTNRDGGEVIRQQAQNGHTSDV
jgi:hypothetical protein